MIVDIGFHGAPFDQLEERLQDVFSFADAAFSHCCLGQNEMVFLGLGYADGALLVGFEHEKLGVEEIQTGQWLEPCAPNGLLSHVVHAVITIELYLLYVRSEEHTSELQS